MKTTKKKKILLAVITLIMAISIVSVCELNNIELYVMGACTGAYVAVGLN